MFFYFQLQVPTGTNNLWGLVSVVQGLDDTLLPQSYSDGIMHVKHLTKFYSVIILAFLEWYISTSLIVIDLFFVSYV